MLVGAVGISPHSTVISEGTPCNSGALSSITVIVWIPCVELLQLSVTVQVRTITKLFAHSPGIVPSFNSIVTSASQPSIAIKFAGSGTSSQETVMSDGRFVISGRAESPIEIF